MLLVDAHCHLDFEDIGEPKKAVERGRAVGVKHIITNGINPETNRKSIVLSKLFLEVSPALGIYPVDAVKLSSKELEEEITFIREHAKEIVAIGEVGLDYHWVKDKKEEMKNIFKKFISLAQELDKPLIVHSRDAEEDTIALLEESAAKRVMMHCFGGNMKLAKRIAENSWFLSIPTSVVYSEHFQKIVETVPLSRLLTETDAPFLGPVKGKTNEPSNIIHAVKKIAEIKKMENEETANIMFKNFQELFL